MKIRIYVMTHKKFEMPQSPLFRPLHVGRACGEDLGYPGDDTGENISDKNCYYSELTGFYWIWKNCMMPIMSHLPLQTVSDQRKRTDLYGEGIPGTVKKIRSGHDQKSPVKQFLLRRILANHNIRALEMTGKVITEKYPEYADAFETYARLAMTILLEHLIFPKSMRKL